MRADAFKPRVTARADMPAKKGSVGFTEEERAALKETTRERKIVWGKDPAGDEQAVLAKIATFPEPDRSTGLRLHSIIRATAPTLAPRLWYGMPAYAQSEEVLCFFQPACKFKARYGTLGFTDAAQLDGGAVWPTSFAVMRLSKSDEEMIATLVKRAVG